MMKTQTQTKRTQRLSILLIGFLSLFTAVQASAEEGQHVFNTQVHIGSDGLAIQQPTITQTEILKTLSQAHHLLTKKIDNAQKVISENNTGKNMAVAAIMPGGLIYLAYKQSKVSSAKTTLAEVKNELASLDKDAITLYQPVYKPASQPIVVARYP